MPTHRPFPLMWRILGCAVFPVLAMPLVSVGEPLRGPYLGQAEPGRDPIVFAPGVVSTVDGYELNAVFSADGREFFFTRLVGGAEKMFTSRQDKAGVWSPPEMLGLSRANREWDEVDMWLPRGRRSFRDGRRSRWLQRALGPGDAGNLRSERYGPDVDHERGSDLIPWAAGTCSRLSPRTWWRSGELSSTRAHRLTECARSWQIANLPREEYPSTDGKKQRARP